MKILHISSERSWRGGEQQIAYLIEESQRQGLTCSVLLRRASSFQKWVEDHKISHTLASFSNAFDLGTASILKQIVRRDNIELIHIHSGKGHDIYALAYLFGLRCPAVLSRRVDFPVKSNPWARWKYNLRSIKRVICVSDAIREMTAPALSEPDKAVTVHSGIDLSRFEDIKVASGLRAKYALSESTILIGNVSALAPHKDLSTFVRTAKTLCATRDDVAFFIIGEGDERERLSSEIKSAGLEKKILLTGFRDDVPAVLKELDIFLITSRTEGLGTTILDAFASGLPVVATEAGGIPESVIHEKTGLLCPVGDHQALSDALSRMIDDEDLRKRMVNNAIEHLQQFTKEETARRTIAIYQEVI